jgi:hypothetical protein
MEGRRNLKTITLLLLLLASSYVFADEDPPLDQCVSDPTGATYRIFQTRNIFTFLKLDTRIGMVWQVQWGENSNVAIVGVAESVGNKAHSGRFVLCPTKNIFTFMLLDQDDGNVYIVQWNNDPKKRFVERIGN